MRADALAILSITMTLGEFLGPAGPGDPGRAGPAIFGPTSVPVSCQ